MSLDLPYRLMAIKFNISHMPVPMTRGLIDLMKEFYTREEAWLLGLMPMMPVSARVVARLQGKDLKKVEPMLLDLVSRGLLVEFNKNGVQKFQMAPFVPGVVEMQLMKGEDTPQARQIAHKMHELLFDMHDEFLDALEKMGSSFARVIPVDKNISQESYVLPYEDARYIINNAKRFALSHCYCRADKDLRGEKACNAPRDICMSFDFAADFLIRNNIGKEADRETMLAKLDLAEKHNLVHMTDNAKDGLTFLCNCCGCCCGLLGAATRLGRKPPVIVSSLIVEWDMAACDHCGKCTRACQIKAFSWINKVTIYSENRCVGCGECIDVCPRGALRLVPRPNWEEPVDTLGDMVADMMAKRVKAGLLLPVKKLPGHKKIAQMVNDINKYE